MSQTKTFLTVVADDQGEVFEHPELLMAGMNGMTVRHPQEDEMIPLPEGSRLFTIPHTPPSDLIESQASRKALKLSLLTGAVESFKRYQPLPPQPLPAPFSLLQTMTRRMWN